MGDKILQGKTVLLGVTGSIAAYKAATLTSILLKMGADVHVVMTRNATKFIAPLTFSTYTKNKVCIDTFDENFEYQVGHISLAEKADVAIIAPATANVIAKLANGIADDMLTTTFLATKAPVLVSPAMNTNMYENPATQANLLTLKSRGIEVIEPDSGLLACGVVGPGKMPEPEELAEHVVYAVAREKTLIGKRVLISAGPTREAIDPVRFISNHSTGKMGYALARCAAMMGAKVTLVSGPVGLTTPFKVTRINVESASDMDREIEKRAKDSDIIIMSAAVADYTPTNVATEKIKKKEGEGAVVELKRTRDILATLGENKAPHQFICGFSMETENVIENSKAKLKRKNVDMIVANNLRTPGAGFGTDTNVVTLIGEKGHEELPLMSKDEVAYAILKVIEVKINS